MPEARRLLQFANERQLALHIHLEEQPAELDATEDVSDLLAKLEASVKRRRGEAGGSDDEEPKKAPAKKAPAKKAAAKKAPAKKAAAKKAPAKKA